MKVYLVQERIPMGKNKHGLFITQEIFFHRQNAESYIRIMYDTMRDLHDYYIREWQTGDEFGNAAEKLDKICRCVENVMGITINDKGIWSANDVFKSNNMAESKQQQSRIPINEITKREEDNQKPTKNY